MESPNLFFSLPKRFKKGSNGLYIGGRQGADEHPLLAQCWRPHGASECTRTRRSRRVESGLRQRAAQTFPPACYGSECTMTGPAVAVA